MECSGAEAPFDGGRFFPGLKAGASTKIVHGCIWLELSTTQKIVGISGEYASDCYAEKRLLDCVDSAAG